MNELAKERAKKAAARKEREERERSAEQKRAQRELKEQLTSTVVTMTTDKVDLVQQLIAHLRPQRQQNGFVTGAADIDTSAPATEAVPQELGAAVRKKLRSVGTSDEHLALVAAHLGPEATSAEALDWLCMHVDASELPPALRGRHRGGVSVIRAAADSNVNATDAAGAPNCSMDVLQAADDPAVQQLMLWGYSVADAVAALERSGGHTGAAWHALFTALVGADNAPAVPPDESAVNVLQRVCTATPERTADASDAAVQPLDGADAAEASWCDELTVLQSMYGADVALATPRCAVLRTQLPSHLWSHFNPNPPPDANHSPDVDLVAMFSPGCGYPDSALPFLAVACGVLPGPVRLEFTARICAQLAKDCAGAPLLHEAFERLRSALDARPPPLLSTARTRYCALMAPQAQSLAAESVTTGSESGQGSGRPQRARKRQQVQAFCRSPPGSIHV